MFCEAISLARLVEADIVSPYRGILINTDVGNPTVPSITTLGGRAGFTRLVGTHSFVRPYKGTRVHLFPSMPSSSFAHPFPHTRAPAPKPTFSSSTFSSYVRSGRQVDGILHHGGTHQEAEGSRILVRGHRASA